jgi:hypothetical protein
MLKSFSLLLQKSFSANFQLILDVIFLIKQVEIYQRTEPKLKIKSKDRIFFSRMMDGFLIGRKECSLLKRRLKLNGIKQLLSFTGDGSLNIKEEGQKLAGK